MPRDGIGSLTRGEVASTRPFEPGQVPLAGPAGALLEVVPLAQRLGIAERGGASRHPWPDVVGVGSGVTTAEKQPSVLATPAGPGKDERPLGGREATSRVTPPRAPAAPPEQRANDDNGAQKAHDR